MKRISKLVVLLILTSLLSAIPVIAQTDQGFEWGFVYDDEIHFMMHLNGTGLQIDEEIYLISNDTLPSIPDSMDNWTDIPYTGIYAYYANGTQLGTEILTFVAMYNVYLPIGNWSFLSTLAQTTHTVENFTLDPEEYAFWGYSWEDDDWVLTDGGVTIYSNYTLNVHVEYLKTGGFLTNYSVDAYNTTTGADAGEIVLERMGLEKYRETTDPMILNQPSNIEYFEGQVGYNITWYASDDYPSTYEILVKHDPLPPAPPIPCTTSLLTSGLWNDSSETITLNVDGLSEGLHTYTLVVYDVSGNNASDTVIVTVRPVTVLPWIMISVVGGLLIVIAAVVFRRR
ncbi:MAG: hypothetical protein ACXABX_00535 [Candidatus Thorarchaeota archaeon]